MSTDTALAKLERKIVETMDMIRRRRSEGLDTSGLEGFWGDLLDQYMLLLKGKK